MFSRIRAALCATAVLVGAAQAAEPAPPQNLADLEARLAESFASDHVPGAAVAVIEGGQVVLLKGFGFADVAKKIPATPDTIFRAGSISKTFTGIAAMTLVEDGKLDLAAKLHDVAPEVHFDNPWEASDPVRVAHLMEHTTGWPDIALRLYMLDGKDWTLHQGVDAASADFVSRYKPGHFPVYNNAGPAVAGYLIEKASGMRFDDYVRQRVLQPMGMATSDFTLTPALESRLAKSYEPDGSETPYQYIVLPPAGSLATSARELAEVVRFFIGRGTIDGRAVLAPASVARIERSETTLASAAGFVDGYGFGNAPFPDSGPVFRGHNGSIDSFTSVFGYRAGDGAGFVLLANGGEGVDFASATTRLVKSYLVRNTKLATPAVTSVPANALEDYSGFYRTITPPNRLAEPYTDILAVTRVAARDGHLVVSGNDFLPIGAHSFQRSDRDAPTLGFVEDGDSVYKIGPFNAQQKQPYSRMAVLWIGEALLALGLVFGVVMSPFWVIAVFRGRLKQRGGAAVRFVPLLGYAALIATFAMPIAQLGTNGSKALHRLADIGPYSLAIFACSLLFPLCAALGIWLAFRKIEAGRLIRIYAAVASVGLAAAALYAARIGWVGAMTWNM
jgi:CubicO group peptidase (beta-lactamase class C family)